MVKEVIPPEIDPSRRDSKLDRPDGYPLIPIGAATLAAIEGHPLVLGQVPETHWPHRVQAEVTDSDAPKVARVLHQ